MLDTKLGNGKETPQTIKSVETNNQKAAPTGSPQKPLVQESKEIPLDDILLGNYQPRKYFAPEKEQELVESVKKDGILEPVLVRAVSDKKIPYELVAGERRYRAAKKAGLNTIPAIVLNCDSKQAIRIGLLENLQREDLNAYEETEGIINLMALELDVSRAEVPNLLYGMEKERKGKANHNVMGKKKSELVEACLKGLMTFESFVKNRLPLLKLPQDILDVLTQSQIEYTKALEIAKVKDEVIRRELLTEAIEQSLSIREIRKKVKSSLPPKEVSELQQRFDVCHQKFKKLGAISMDSEKQQKLKTIIEQLLALVA